MKHGEKINLLDEYSNFLEEHGYMDTDWRDEEPYAIDRFLKHQRDKVKDLFGDEIIRTLGLYQPFAGLMLPPYNKVETRWVKNGKKAPFPLGKYLIYATKFAYSKKEFLRISGKYGKDVNLRKLIFRLNGQALCIGELASVYKMTTEHEKDAYVVHANVDSTTHTRWCLLFVNMKPIDPFPVHGKQGVGFLSPEDKAKIKFL